MAGDHAIDQTSRRRRITTDGQGCGDAAHEPLLLGQRQRLVRQLHAPRRSGRTRPHACRPRIRTFRPGRHPCPAPGRCPAGSIDCDRRHCPLEAATDASRLSAATSSGVPADSVTAACPTDVSPSMNASRRRPSLRPGDTLPRARGLLDRNTSVRPPAERDESAGQIRMGQRVIGVQPERLPPLDERLLVPADEQIERRQVVPWHIVAGKDPLPHLKRVDRSFYVAFHEPAIVLRDVEVFPLADRASQRVRRAPRTRSRAGRSRGCRTTPPAAHAPRRNPDRSRWRGPAEESPRAVGRGPMLPGRRA